MRKISFILMLLSFSLCSWGRVVTKEKAEECAARFFNLVSTRGGYPELTMVWDGMKPLTRTVEAPPFYVFNKDNGGFVIIAGEDAARPVLAYSHSGSFNPDNMPDNLIGWMDDYHSEINYLREKGIAGNADVQQMWSEVGARTRTVSGEVILNTALWGQEKPYNLQCPIDNYNTRHRSPTGCAATAMSIVMYYYRIPKGDLLSESGSSSVDGFDWDKMLPDYSGTYTADEGNAVAYLMSVNGVRSQMHYDPYGSSTSPENVRDAILNYRYADGSYIFDRNIELRHDYDYETDDWIRMLKSEIDEDRPIMYYGYNGGGHAFLVDGYGDGEYFHFNWGYDGEGNGMYLLSTMGGDKYGYIWLNRAIFGFKPDTYVPQISLNGSVELYYGTVNSRGSTFWVDFNGITNSGERSYSGMLKVALVGADGQVKAFCGVSSVSDLSVGESTSKTISIVNTKPLGLGDRFVLYYSARGEMVPVIRKDETMALPVVAMSAIYVNPDGYKAGDEFVFSLTNTTEAHSSVAWTFDGESVSGPSVTLTSGTHKIKCVIRYSDGTTEKLMQGIIVK